MRSLISIKSSMAIVLAIAISDIDRVVNVSFLPQAFPVISDLILTASSPVEHEVAISFCSPAGAPYCGRRIDKFSFAIRIHFQGSCLLPFRYRPPWFRIVSGYVSTITPKGMLSKKFETLPCPA